MRYTFDIHIFLHAGLLAVKTWALFGLGGWKLNLGISTKVAIRIRPIRLFLFHFGVIGLLLFDVFTAEGRRGIRRGALRQRF